MQYGEIINLGRHRLMCGDATKIEDINALVAGEEINLVLTDPPYGMKCQNKDGAISSVENRYIKGAKDERFRNTLLSSRKYPMLIGDDNNHSARDFYTNIKDYTATKIFWGGQYFADFLPISGSWLFWDKKTGNNDFSDGELAWCLKGKRVRKYEQMWNGTFRAGQRQFELKQRVHPTQKPVELHARILEDFSKPGDIVLDAFGGSGTTLIACEITGRTCLMMEISPEYCDIIRARYEKLTGGNLPLEWKRESE